MMKIVNFLFVVLFLKGCLLPYDNEFTCKPSIIGECTSSVVDTYKNTLETIDNKEKK